MKIPAWQMLAGIYVSWNLFLYTCENWIRNQTAIDHIYWFYERVFVIVTWICIYQQVKESRYKHYAWLPKSLIWIAILKYIYLLLVVVNWLPANKMWGLIGFLFVLTLGYIIRKWEKSGPNY